MHSALELVANLGSLVPLPAVYLRVRDELDAPNGSVSAVARAIGADPAMTASVLRLVNSAFYGYGGKIGDISRAVTLLGLQQVHDLVLAISVCTTFRGLHPRHLDMPAFWRGSVLRGLAAREVGRNHGMLGSERLFVMGLLSDLGHLVMYQTVPDLANEAELRAESDDAPLYASERAIVGCDHAELAACLLSHWNLPETFPSVIGAQLDPRLAGDHAFEAACVHLAARIADADRRNLASSSAAAPVSAVVWSTLDMTPADFRDIRATAELEIGAYSSLLLSDPGGG